MPKKNVTDKPANPHGNAVRASDKALDAMGGKDLKAAMDAADDAVKVGLVVHRVDVDKG